MTTTNTVQGHDITACKGVVTGRSITGANVFGACLAGIGTIVNDRPPRSLWLISGRSEPARWSIIGTLPAVGRRWRANLTAH